MIKNLEIENFKSIKHLKLDCKRINLFIGEPNTGKSNILETLSLLSYQYYGDLENFVRFENMNNLFYNENLEENLTIKTDNTILEINFNHGSFKGRCLEVDSELFNFNYDYSGHGTGRSSGHLKSPCKFYKFAIRRDFPRKEPDFLLPPSGANLLAILQTHKGLRSTVNQIFMQSGLRLVFEPQEDKIKVLKSSEDTLVLFPYFLASDTLQRISFYLTAIDSNKNSVLVFEEPESHAFPYYTKFLAERIALDKANNQYFIATHNPYLLLSIIEKARKDEVAIFITYFEDYQTKVKLLSEKELSEIMDMGIDIFFNIERFLEVKE
ncbi:MAG TPA: AAA family ATPase [Desulfobacteria bacterium]|nr:AAA family ATPase [Desulfobacteria bacterium]